jgi:hypothetical protein
MLNLGPALVVVFVLPLAALVAYVGGYLLLPWETRSFAYCADRPN